MFKNLTTLSVLTLLIFSLTSCSTKLNHRNLVFENLHKNISSNTTEISSSRKRASQNRTFTGINFINREDLTEPLEKALTFPPPKSNASELSETSTRDLQNKTTITEKIDFVCKIRETENMQNYFHYFRQKKHQTFQNWLDRAQPYLPYIRRIFSSKGLPLDLIFLPFAESGFNPWAYSHARAAGLWQFIPGTAKKYGLKVNWWVDERRNPYKSTRAAANYLKDLYQNFRDWYLVLAAYNSGKHYIEKAMEKSNKSNYFELAGSHSLLHKETRFYVPKFMAILKIVKNLEELGFEPIDWKCSPDLEKITVSGGTDLYALSRAIGWEWSEFRHKNPSFRRHISPPNAKHSVYIPKKMIQQAQNFVNNPESAPYKEYRRYTVKKGDSWWKLSRLFQIPIRILKNVNNKRSNLLHPGQSVLIPGANSKHIASLSSSTQYNHKYRVKRGDSIWEISRRFNIEIAKLKQVNNLYKSSKHLQVGKLLKIPANSAIARKRKLAAQRANYQVSKGDTLWEISRKYGVSLRTLKQANGLTGNGLQVGTKLYIPDMSGRQTQLAKQRAKSAHSTIVKYIVKKGDNLWKIAQKFGISHSKLLAWNNISKNELIHPGDKLSIYLK